MATTTPNIGLVLEDNLTSTARSNLLKLDSLGSTFLVDSRQNTVIRSRSDIILLPNEPSSGGTGVGGSLQVGIEAQPLTALTIYSDDVTLGSGFSLLDTASGSTGTLKFVYKSDLTGSLDNGARQLTIDTEGENRDLVMSGSLHVLGGEVRLTGPASVTLPESGTLVNQNSAETLTNKSLDALRLVSGAYNVVVQTPTLTESYSLTLPDDSGTTGQVLTKGAGTALSWSDPAVGNEDVFTWANAEGTTLTIVHNYNSYNILVQVLDNDNDYATIELDQVTRPTPNTVQLVSSSAPPTTWTVLVKEIE